MRNKPKIYKFPNGAILLYKKRKMCDATAVNAGFWAGHNYIENIDGLPHFVEHMLFKGTYKRTENQILEDETKITSLNATTSPYSIYINFFESNKKVKESFDFASDILLNTKLDESSIESEKKVVFEERERAKDRAIKDIYVQQFRFMEKEFKLDEDRRLGTEETLGKATKKDIQEFINKHFVSDKFFISVASSLSFYKIKKLTKVYFINKLRVAKEKSTIIPYNYFKLENKEGINFVKNLDKTIKGLVSIKFHVDNGEKYKNDYNLSCLIADINTRTDTFHNMARKEGLVYTSGASINYNGLSSSMTVDFDFTTSKIENVDKLMNLIGDTIKIYKNQAISLDRIEEHKEKAIISLDKSFPSKYRETVSYMQSEYNKYKKIENFTKKQKVKFFKAVNLNSIKENIDVIFNKKNKVYITFMGDIDEGNFKSLKEYKQIIFKK